jgi:adenosylmethionine-8-amino-7-oxononanoate aminotransferase
MPMVRPAFLHPFSRPAADAAEFITFVRGEGACVFDADGNRYIDALAALWFCQVGHGRREIADAVGDQLRTLAAFHCFDIFTNGPADELAEQLVALAPMPDARVFLTSSGSEAVDAAIKLVHQAITQRGDADRRLIVTRRHAYHGVTYGGLSVMGLPANQAGWGSLLGGVETVAHDDLGAVEALFAARGPEIAAVIAEPVMGAGGVRPPAEGYLAGLRRLCDEHGAFLVLDEVICGFGRLGAWWGATAFDVRPDVVAFAKGVTSGYQPLGGVLVGPSVRAPLEADPDVILRTGHTYSGHPAACRAALANLAIIRDEGLADRASNVIGARLGPALHALLDKGCVQDVRGVAGLWAVDLPDGVSNTEVGRDLMDRGVIVRPIGTSTIALCPPLVITEDETDELVAALTASLL